jgi:hypothetical protein
MESFHLFHYWDFPTAIRLTFLTRWHYRQFLAAFL